MKIVNDKKPEKKIDLDSLIESLINFLTPLLIPLAPYLLISIVLIKSSNLSLDIS